MQQGVRSEVISYSHTENRILQRYAQIIDELGKPAIDQLNRYGNLPDSFVADLRTRNGKRKMIMVTGLTAGGILLTGIVIWTIKK